MSIEKTTLANGVRVVTETLTHVGSASIGLWCKTGSADEFESEAGITHLIEHMLFKGTKKRSAKQIAEEIEGRGGMLNAFTDKQATCYYCRVLKEDAEIAIDVLCDMMIDSQIDPEELEREKGVVLEEIKRGEDEPGDHVHEIHMERRWPDHPLGRAIIGTKESVSSFNRDNLVAYMDRQYRGENILLAAAGNVSHPEIVKWAEMHLGGIKSGAVKTEHPRPNGVPGFHYEAKDIEQVHFCIGTDAPSLYDDELHTAAVLDHIMGGGMSSRLFQEVREKRGLVYAVGTYSLNYSAGGTLNVYGGTSADTWQQVQEIVRTEFDKMMKDGPTDDEIDKVRRSISGTMVLSLEGMSSRMMRMARNELIRGRDVPVEETLEKINRVTKKDVANMAQKLFAESVISVTAIGPKQS